MHYYRYRPYTEIALKELLYSEMYFASAEECNDPFDSLAFYEFEGDVEKWERLLHLAGKTANIQIDNSLISKLAEYAAKECPIQYEDVQRRPFFAGLEGSTHNDNLRIQFIERSLRDLIQLYGPQKPYFVSFSRTESDSLMWSHYADHHRGFCLIFKAIEGYLATDPNFRRKNIRRSTPRAIAKEMTFGLPESFQFRSIDYKQDIERQSAFIVLPEYVSGKPSSEEEVKNILVKRELHHLQKGQSWHYENESRLILSPPPSWLCQDRIEYTKQERLFHFEPAQLAGIIFGARMKNEDRHRIRDLLEIRSQRINETPQYKRTVFSFFEFEAHMETGQRSIGVKPIFLRGHPGIAPSDDNFDRLLSEWKSGIGWERDGTSSTRIQVD